MIKNVFFPLYHFKLPYNERYITYIKILNKTQWLSFSELEKIQLNKLKKLLKHAYNNVPYYNKMFKNKNLKPESFSSIKELNKLPILTKELLNKNFKNLYAKNYSKDKFILSNTGGSTATPTKFYIDRIWSACNAAAAYRSWSWANYNIGDKMAYLWGAVQDLKNSDYMDKFRNYLLRIIKLNAFNLTTDSMEKYTNILKKFKPKIINSYASAMFTFSDYIKKMGIDYIKPNSILTTGDMLYDYKRKSIEQAFNCEVFDYYSGRDTSLIAAECQEHFGYHLSIENAIVEYIKNDECVSSGETGNIIITDLCNYAMPFIRYEIGDLGTPSDERCPCGRNLPIMKSLKGRTYDYIITPEGKSIPGIFFHYLIIYYKIQGIKEFQIIQKIKNKVIINIIKNENEAVEDINRFISLIQKNVGDKVKIEVKFTSYIKPTQSGKLRRIISYINNVDGSQL